MSKGKEEALEGVIVIVLSLASWGAYWYVGPILWGWFMVPLGVPAVTWQHFAGLSTLRGLMFYRYQKQDTEEALKRAITAAILPWTGLLLGWLFT